MEDAKRIEKQKEELDAIRTEALRKIDQEAGAFLEKAKQQAEKMKEDMLASAKKETEQMLERGRMQLEAERAQVMHELQGNLARMIVSLTEKILEREFSDADQNRILTNLEKHIPALLK
jgi:F-type H+-transporting ATPase subunit b